MLRMLLNNVAKDLCKAWLSALRYLRSLFSLVSLCLGRVCSSKQNNEVYAFEVNDSWGVASVRQHCGYSSVQSSVYIAPLGCSIVNWDIEKKTRTKFFQAHNDLIVVLVKSLNQRVLSVSYSGEVKLWNDAFEMLVQFQSELKHVVYGSWSTDGQFFAACCLGLTTRISVFAYDDVVSKYQQHKSIVPLWFYELNNNAADSYFSICLFPVTSVPSIISVYQTTTDSSFYTFKMDGSLEVFVKISPNDEVTCMCSSEIVNGVIAVGFNKGTFRIFDTQTLKLLSTFMVQGTSQVCQWNDMELVVVSYDTGVMTWWTQQGILIRQVSGAPVDSIVHMSLSPASSISYWLGGIMSLHYITLSEYQSSIAKSLDLKFLSLTGCGICVSEDGVVATGDFTGNVCVWNHQQATPVKRFHVPSSVRSLIWFQDFVMTGCLNSQLYLWEMSHSIHGSLMYHFEGGVIAMKLDSVEKTLAVGTTKGYLYVFAISIARGTVVIERIYACVQHFPKHLPDGTQRFMEIWGLAWSPEDTMIVTTSEDQTAVIADAPTGKILHTLTGHSAAVTSVGWKVLSTKQNILVTCSDDRTCRIYDGESFKLNKVVNTKDIYGWHTLTYLIIKDDLLIVSTQNGYLVVWDLKTYGRVLQYKMHAGSVEGMVLSYDLQYINTVGSDGVVNSLSLIQS